MNDYSKGWKDGHCEGWREVKGQHSLCPITPLCPAPELDKGGYKGGYNRGFKRGMKDARNWNNLNRNHQIKLKL